jgi:hypothetical protein
MRRKLIKQEAFDRICNESVSTRENELVQASDIIAKALGKDRLSLHSFTETTVLFETEDSSYVHAGYEINNGNISFHNVEELVVDDQSRREKRKAHLSEMIDSLLTKNEPKAQALFGEYMEMVNWVESKKIADAMCGKDDDNPFPFKKGKKDKKKGKKGGFPFGGKKRGKKDKEEVFEKAKKNKELAEMYVVACDVLDYADYVKNGPVMESIVTKEDEKGNVTDLRIPTSKVRNEGKVLEMGFKTMSTKLIVHARKARKLAESQEFCKAVVELKKQNSLSDANGVEHMLESIAKAYPEVLYVTQDNLAEMIGESLHTCGITSYDDKTCEFLAEGILRKAHAAYSEKVNQILHLAGATKTEGNDPYVFFQTVVADFYPRLDEEFGLERKAFEDIYGVLENLWNKADRRGNESLKRETAAHINEVAAVLNGQIKPDIAIAEEAADWLASLVETNLGTKTWDVSNKAHQTENGDHPDMAKKARQGYAPSSDGGGDDWGDPLPMVPDGKGPVSSASKSARTSSWGNYDGLVPNKPPKPFGDYTMKGEKGVDKDTFGQFHSTWQSKDTWPNLKNPYIPAEKVKTGGKGYKMKNGPETDLIVDK